MFRHCLWFALLLMTMDPKSTSHVEALAGSSTSGDNNSGEVPQLPPPDPDSNLPTIRLGETIRLEEMGPIILNTDGTTRRIDNWDSLTEREKEVTWRRISKRNEERRKALLELQQQQETQSNDKEL